MSAGPWAQYGNTANQTPPWEKYGNAAPGAAPPAAIANPITQTRDSIDQQLNAPPTEPGIRGEIQNFGQTAAKTLLSPVLHPIDTAKGIAQSVGSLGIKPVMDEAHSLKDAYQQGGIPRALSTGLGQGAGMLATGGAMGAAGDLIPKAGTAIRSAAIGDPNVALLKGLRVGPASPKALSTVSAGEGARPFLQGAKNLEDLQSRVGAAKGEIWTPYDQAVQKVGGNPVHGPDGPTTVRDLEAERQQLSALNRGLKTGKPDAVQLAQQKGMNQAQLLDREKAVQAALDPELQKAGVNPQLIRKTFGQVANIGGRVAGKSTLAEADQPYGFSKLKDISVTKPLSNIPLAGSAARDILAGRYLSAKPTDVAIREAFRPGGAKPDFSVPISQPPVTPGQRLLPGVRTMFTPPPGGQSSLPASVSSGEAQPMIGVRAPYHPGVAPEFTSERPVPTQFARPQILPPAHRIAGPEGIQTAPRGLLHSGPPEELPASAARIRPPGSVDPFYDENLYPAASRFRSKP